MRFTALLFSACLPLNALNIHIDYRYDTSGFFSSGNPHGASGGALAKAALEAAATRWSAIIDQTLLPVQVLDHPSTDVRLSFPDPSNYTGEDNPALIYDIYEAGSAASSATDSLVSPGLRPPADQYRNGIGISANTFIIYVGGRGLPDDAFTGAFVGHNHDSVINDGTSILNRGFNIGSNSLPAWGSSISFNSNEDATNYPQPDTRRKWHFDHTTPVPNDAKDFYSVALAEIGRALGFGLFYQEFTGHVVGSEFRGTFAVGTYQIESNTQITGLDLEGTRIKSFKRGQYTSNIYTGGNPNYVDTVGAGNPQPVLFQARHTLPPDIGPFDPEIFEFIPGIIPGNRYEITNVDVAVIRDLGWSIATAGPGNPQEEILVTLSQDSGGDVILTFPSENNATYTVQTSTNMADWVDVTPALASEGTTTNWTDGEEGFTDPLGPANLLPYKFYRVLKND